MSLHILLTLLLALGAAGLRADGGAVLSASPTAGTDALPSEWAFGGLKIPATDLVLTPKAGYVHVMVDLYPQKEALAALGKKAAPKALALALVRDALSPRFPKAPFFKVLFVEMPVRDEYNAPRWDKLVVVGRFEVHPDKKGFRVKAVKP